MQWSVFNWTNVYTFIALEIETDFCSILQSSQKVLGHSKTVLQSFMLKNSPNVDNSGTYFGHTCFPNTIQLTTWHMSKKSFFPNCGTLSPIFQNFQFGPPWNTLFNMLKSSKTSYLVVVLWGRYLIILSCLNTYFHYKIIRINYVKDQNITFYSRI